MTAYFIWDERFEDLFKGKQFFRLSKKCSIGRLGTKIYVFYNDNICADLILKENSDNLKAKIRNEALLTGEWIGMLQEFKLNGIKGRKKEFLKCSPEFYQNSYRFRTPEEHKRLLKAAKRIRDPN